MRSIVCTLINQSFGQYDFYDREECSGQEEEEEEERSLIIDLKRHARLAVAWSLHGSLVPRWT